MKNTKRKSVVKRAKPAKAKKKQASKATSSSKPRQTSGEKLFDAVPHGKAGSALISEKEARHVMNAKQGAPAFIKAVAEPTDDEVLQAESAARMLARKEAGDTTINEGIRAHACHYVQVLGTGLVCDTCGHPPPDGWKPPAPNLNIVKGVYQSRERHSAIVVAVSKLQVQFITFMDGPVEVRTWGKVPFADTFAFRLDGYPVRRAARIYLNTLFTKTEEATRLLRALLAS